MCDAFLLMKPSFLTHDDGLACHVTTWRAMFHSMGKLVPVFTWGASSQNMQAPSLETGVCQLGVWSTVSPYFF